jgi:hypothetical protein
MQAWMRGRFTLEFSLGDSHREGVNMFDPDKWAESVDRTLKDVSEKRRQQAEAFTERRKLLQQEAPSLWPKLKAAFKQLCDSFNKRQGREALLLADTSPEMFLIRLVDSPNMVATVLRDHAHGSLSVTVGQYKEAYKVVVIEDGSGSVTYAKGNIPLSAEEIALIAMNAFFGMNS